MKRAELKRAFERFSTEKDQSLLELEHKLRTRPDFKGETLVEIKDLKKYFQTKKGIFSRETKRVRAVDGIDLKIRKGEIFGLVGESGCGKTTVGRLILRLTDPTEGEINFDGHDLMGLSKEEMRKMRRRMGIIFQHPQASLNPRMSVAGYIGRVFDIHDIARGHEKEERILKVIREVGLEQEHLDRYPHEFSGGQQQRIVIARVLALNPEFVVLDEPTSALDVSVQAHILNLLSRLHRKFGFTYLLISHDLSIIEHMSDRIAVMYVGKIVELAEKDELQRNAKHPYTLSLLSAAPVPDPEHKREEVVLKGEIPSSINPPKGCRFHTRCPYAESRCSREEPKLRDIGGGHYVACHRLRDKIK